MGCGGLILFGVVLAVAALVFQIPYAGPPIAVVIFIGAVWIYVAYKKAPAPPTQDAAQLSPTAQTIQPAQPAATAPASATHEATLVRLGSCGRQGVAGEYYRAKDLARVVARRRAGQAGDWANGLRELALLEREPRNRHDRNAVRVRMFAQGSWLTVGYLPRDTALRWQPTLIALERRGVVGSCPALIYRDGRGDGYQIVLSLSAPESAVFGNGLPDGAETLDAERECAVTGEQQYQEALSARDGWLGPVWATLHPATVPTGKQAGAPTIEAHIDGEIVGTLTAAQGERYSGLLRPGVPVACEAEIFMGTRGREARLFLPRVD